MVYIDSIFFDIDGTLIDARQDIVTAMNYALRQMGFPEKPFDEIVSYVGTGVTYLIAKSLGSEKADLVERGVELYTNYYIAHPADKATLYPHAREILEHFKKKRKIILTNRYTRFAEPVLNALDIRGYFEDIVGGDDEKCLKPSACVLEPVVSRLRIDKSRSLIIGDMAVDIMTGKNSGIKTCWIRHGLGKDEDVRPLDPDFIIDDLIELKGIIE
ncbi:MAG: HAD-IA family hydrolase [Candidatus Omnitrophica bacterium]|nr:HAD-IA family hydrolase [Candidatus Omnitrophota bacterium]MDD5436591.1 HAD-IA family hydrolase [Candidatus Omnitrophota bacterium]